MARHSEAERVSVTAFLFPLLSVLYFEAVFSYFAQAEMTVYKVLFALSAGALALALSRLTPFRVLNFILQTAWLLFCGGLTAAQFLCFRASGAYISLFGGGARPAGGALFSAALESLPFLACLLPPLAVQLTLQRGALLHRGSLPGRLLGADWLEPIGALLLAVILAFVSVTLAFYDADGEASPRHRWRRSASCPRPRSISNTACCACTARRSCAGTSSRRTAREARFQRNEFSDSIKKT